MSRQDVCLCEHCGDDDVAVLKHADFGWICDSCLAEFERVERETDWDAWDEARRARLAESCEY
ncbi:MAG: hypothetical protein LPH21_03230 [Shewanella sp.]|nr:hypothetical protein [Shewanella sp.]